MTTKIPISARMITVQATRVGSAKVHKPKFGLLTKTSNNFWYGDDTKSTVYTSWRYEFRGWIKLDSSWWKFMCFQYGTQWLREAKLERDDRRILVSPTVRVLVSKIPIDRSDEP